MSSRKTISNSNKGFSSSKSQVSRKSSSYSSAARSLSSYSNIYIYDRSLLNRYESVNHYYYNPYLYHSVYHSVVPEYIFQSTLTAEQIAAADDTEVDISAVQNPEVDTYWITIKIKDEEKRILVTKNQYEKISAHDKIELINNKIYLNGDLLED
ncbi:MULTISPECIES: hypothetical protein [Enterococcus]|uniref:hypothetical protein n=1 Tax=Enterococcus TaxID=1350 RepID=UPI000B6C3DF9|nr:hypothetical protein [Enterococcus sp. 4E1_DIV0656]OTO09218.1 hypothetical protein A5882_003548 [Enterococcus sp. 4E1_DIV0656]